MKQILEAVILTAAHPLNLTQLLEVFPESNTVELKTTLAELTADYAERGIELKEVASGYRFQAKQAYAPWVAKLFEEKPAKYSRATLETLVIIAYRQPVTRGDIEHIRGVAVNTQIIKNLLDREWIKVIGHRDVPGKPAIFGTTKVFLDYFNLKSLAELPQLPDLKDIEQMVLNLEQPLETTETTEVLS